MSHGARLPRSSVATRARLLAGTIEHARFAVTPIQLVGHCQGLRCLPRMQRGGRGAQPPNSNHVKTERAPSPRKRTGTLLARRL